MGQLLRNEAVIRKSASTLRRVLSSWRQIRKKKKGRRTRERWIKPSEEKTTTNLSRISNQQSLTSRFPDSERNKQNVKKNEESKTEEKSHVDKIPEPENWTNFDFLFKSHLSIKPALKYDKTQLDALSSTNVASRGDEREDKLLKLDLKAIELAQLTKQEYSGNKLILDWANSGFRLRNYAEFEAILKSDLDESTLKEFFGKIIEYYEISADYAESIVDTEEAANAEVEISLSKFFNLLVIDRKKYLPAILDITKLNSLEDVNRTFSMLTSDPVLLKCSAALFKFIMFCENPSNLYLALSCRITVHNSLKRWNNYTATLPLGKRNELSFPPPSAEFFYRQIVSRNYEYVNKVLLHSIFLLNLELAVNNYLRLLDPPLPPETSYYRELEQKVLLPAVTMHEFNFERNGPCRNCEKYSEYQSHGFSYEYANEDFRKTLKFWEDYDNQISDLNAAKFFVDEFAKEQRGCRVESSQVKCHNWDVEQQLKRRLRDKKWRGYQYLKSFIGSAFLQPNMEAVRTVSISEFNKRIRSIQELKDNLENKYPSTTFLIPYISYGDPTI